MEQIWLKKAQNGDSKAYMKVFELYEKDLYRLAYIQTNNSDDALDIVQEVAYRSYKYIHSLRQFEFFKTWLIRILINVTNDFLKKKLHYEELEDHIAFTHDIPSIDIQITLQMIMEYLTPLEKQIVYLKYYEDYTFEQIANITEKKLGSVKTILYRALHKLRDEMAKEGFDEIQRRAT